AIIAPHRSWSGWNRKAWSGRPITPASGKFWSAGKPKSSIEESRRYRLYGNWGSRAAISPHQAANGLWGQPIKLAIDGARHGWQKPASMDWSLDSGAHCGGDVGRGRDGPAATGGRGRDRPAAAARAAAESRRAATVLGADAGLPSDHAVHAAHAGHAARAKQRHELAAVDLRRWTAAAAATAGQ